MNYRRGDYLGEVRQDGTFTVRRGGGPVILKWGKEENAQKALERVEQFVDGLFDRERKAKLN